MEIILNGETKELRFSNSGIKKFEEIAKIDLLNSPKLSEIGEQDLVNKLVFAGLYGSYYRNSKLVDFTMQDVVKWVDDLSPIEHMKVVQFFTASCLTYTSKMLEAFTAMGGGEEVEKKK